MPLPSPTPRQLDVAACLAQGFSYAQTARELGISVDTVRAHTFSLAQRIPNPAGLSQQASVIQWVRTAA